MIEKIRGHKKGVGFSEIHKQNISKSLEGHPSFGGGNSFHKEGCGCPFCRKDFSNPWNKGKKNSQIPWNKGLTKLADARVVGGWEFHEKNSCSCSFCKARRGEDERDLRIYLKPSFWEGVRFLSKEEREVAKILLSRPIDGVNCNIKIRRKIIDFFPQPGDKRYVGCFVEYHPFDRMGRSFEEYEESRRHIIEESIYRGTPIFVITSIKELKKEDFNVICG